MSDDPCEAFHLRPGVAHCEVCGWPKLAHTHEVYDTPDRGPFDPMPVRRII